MKVQEDKTTQQKRFHVTRSHIRSHNTQYVVLTAKQSIFNWQILRNFQIFVLTEGPLHWKKFSWRCTEAVNRAPASERLNFICKRNLATRSYSLPNNCILQSVAVHNYPVGDVFRDPRNVPKKFICHVYANSLEREICRRFFAVV